MSSVLDQLFELLIDELPRKQDQKLLKQLIAEYKKNGADSVIQAISNRIEKIIEEIP